jgi:hypothetical protein
MGVGREGNNRSVCWRLESGLESPTSGGRRGQNHCDREFPPPGVTIWRFRREPIFADPNGRADSPPSQSSVAAEPAPRLTRTSSSVRPGPTSADSERRPPDHFNGTEAGFEVEPDNPDPPSGRGTGEVSRRKRAATDRGGSRVRPNSSAEARGVGIRESGVGIGNRFSLRVSKFLPRSQLLIYSLLIAISLSR